MADWNHSFVIYSLLQRPVVQVEWKTLLASHHRIIFRLSWAPSTTGRVEGYPENQQAPQLQDLLEYYTNIEENAQAVAGAAFNSAVKKYELMPRLLLPPLPPPEDQPDDSGRSARETADAEESWKGVRKAIEYDVADSWI